MTETITLRLRGGLDACGTGVVQFAAALDAAERAMEKLGWHYTRFLFNESRYYLPEGAANAKKWLDTYRQRGLDERYFHKNPLGNTPLTEYAAANFRRDEIVCGEDREQERLLRSLWSGKCPSRDGRKVKYQGIAVPGEEFVTDCSVWIENGISASVSVSVTVSGGWSRGIWLRIASVFADEMGMKVDKRRVFTARPRVLSSENGKTGV